MNEVTKPVLKDKNRFACSYNNCKRILSKGGTKSFQYTSCGHGTMRLIKPTTYCMECGEPVFGNITPSNEKVAFFGGHDFVDIICPKCTHGKVEEITKLEKLLHTKFTDTDDYNEKLAYYEAKVKEAKESDTDVSKVRVKTICSRLKVMRKKLGLTQKQLAEYINITQRSIINYEKNVRPLPEEIKEWVKTTESTFKHLGREKGKAIIMKKLMDITSGTKSHCQTAKNVHFPPRECEQKQQSGASVP